MDTTLKHRFLSEKIVTSITSLSIAICLLLTQNMLSFAKDLNIGAYTGLTPAIDSFKFNHKCTEVLFNQAVEGKYKNSTINNVDKGIKHIQMIRYYNGKPVRLNIIELSAELNQSLKIEPIIASTSLSSKTKISNMATRNNAIVAINGGYFKPQTGVPLGTLMINKKFYTGPIYERVSIGFFEDGYDIARLKLNAVLETNIGGFKIDNVNQPRMLSTHTIVYTRDWGKTTPLSPKYGSQLVVKSGKIINLTSNSTVIPEDGFVVVGPTKFLEPISKAKHAKLKMNTSPTWKNVNHIISGGPYLVKDGEVFVDMTAQKLNSIGGRNPRTAIGYTEDNHLILVTADGRENSSIGLTLFELASLMKEFGCTNAMNLDGGSSTVMYVNGKVVNKPQVQGGIPLSHTLTIYKKDLS